MSNDSKQLTTRSKEWLERRRGWVGASEVASVLGINPYSSPYEVWLEKTGQIENPFTGNDATDIGHALEPLLLDDAERDLGELMRDVEVPHPKAPIRATLDGQVVDSGNVIECKTAGFTGGRLSSEWGEPGTDQIPAPYTVQVQVQLACTGAELAYVYAWLCGRGRVRYEVRPDVSFDRWVCGYVHQWWQTHIIEGQEPDFRGASLQTLSKLKRTEPAVDLPEELEQLVHRHRKLKQLASRASDQAKEIQRRIIEELGKSERGTFPSGTAVSYLEQTRKEHTVPASTFRVFRIKESK